MPTVTRTPESLAEALLSKPVTPARIRRLLWHARKRTEAEFRVTLAAIPDPKLRAEVEAASHGVSFRG